MIGQFVLSLSLLVVLHELGHFIPAKLFKTKVEKFYLFFDPYFSLVKKKIGETEYGIGWLPLGGYVKIAGMIDESMDKEQMKKPPQPWEFRSKPAWQRLIIMLGGVIVNFILGFLIFSMIFWRVGSEYLPNDNVKYGIMVDELGEELGLQNGDKILQIGDQTFDKFNPVSIRKEIGINNARSIIVERDGQEKIVDLDPDIGKKLLSYEYKDMVVAMPRMPTVVGQVSKGYPAADAGIQKDDKILGINGVKYPYFDQLRKELKTAKGETVNIDIQRGDEMMSLPATVSETGQLGFFPYGASYFFDSAKEKHSLGESVVLGVREGWDFLATQIKAFGQMFRGKIKASDSLGGFASLTKLFPTTWDWVSFWRITAILSLILGFMNLLPIPALDGGHVLFLLIEMITGRKMSDRFMEIATIAGFIIVISLVLFANGLDVWRWFKGM